MKTSSRQFLGALTGLIAAYFVPLSQTTVQFITSVSNIVLDAGRYILFPLVFFSLPIAITKLRRNGTLRRVLFRTALFAAAASAILAVLGTILASSLPIERLPVVSGLRPPLEAASLEELFRSILVLKVSGTAEGKAPCFLCLLCPPYCSVGIFITTRRSPNRHSMYSIRYLEYFTGPIIISLCSCPSCSLC